MEEIKKMLISMQEEMRQQKIDMQDMKDDIKNTINNNVNEKFKQIETKHEQLEKNFEKQKTALDNLERFKRRKNLIIFGVEENENSYYDLEKIILDIIRKSLKIQCEDNCIEYVRRLGKKGQNVRPIVITLLTMGLKIKIQRNKKKLETTSYYIKEDYPIDVLKRRKELQSEVEKERAQGRKAILKYDKLIIINNEDKQKQQTLSIETHNKKRSLPESPETLLDPSKCNGPSTSQPKKINRMNNIDNYLLKAPTFTYPENSSSQTQGKNKNQDK